MDGLEKALGWNKGLDLCSVPLEKGARAVTPKRFSSLDFTASCSYTLKHGSPKLSVVLVQKIHLFLVSQEDNTYWE